MSSPFPPAGISGASAMTNPGLNPFMLPSRWDQIVIGGVTWNGKIEIRGAKRPYKWQPKDTRGAESWDDTYQGLFPKPFTVVFFLYTSVQFASWITIFRAVYLLWQQVRASAGIYLSPGSTAHRHKHRSSKRRWCASPDQRRSYVRGRGRVHAVADRSSARQQGGQCHHHADQR